MTVLVLMLIPAALAVSCVVTSLVLRATSSAGMLDTAAMPGQVKEAARRVPNTGGIGVVAGVIVPMAAGLGVVWLGAGGAGSDWLGSNWLGSDLPGDAAVYLDGVRSETWLGLLVMGGVLVLHALGLVDDRKPLGPVVKLLVMAAVALAVIVAGDTRLFTALDSAAGGSWASVLLTLAWFLAVTNAMNFIDNMDGLSAGATLVASGCFLVASLVAEQWFVSAMLALLVGACAGFLVWNRPPARIFMGDGGSLVLGFLLAFLTTRTTYFGQTPEGTPLAGGWYGVFMPVLVLAVPLYDLVSVTAIRIRQGRSPMVGDLQHLSHRLVKRGFSKAGAVGVMLTLTVITGISGIVIGRLPAWGAALVAAQTCVLLGLLATIEFATSPSGARRDSLEVGHD
ncbi:MAG: MraY family glycosyltransferase [Planctomycetota bacterium]